MILSQPFKKKKENKNFYSVTSVLRINILKKTQN